MGWELIITIVSSSSLTQYVRSPGCAPLAQSTIRLRSAIWRRLHINIESKHWSCSGTDWYQVQYSWTICAPTYPGVDEKKGKRSDIRYHVRIKTLYKYKYLVLHSWRFSTFLSNIWYVYERVGIFCQRKNTNFFFFFLPPSSFTWF